MNKFLAVFFCLGAAVAAYDDGQWRGEGLLESQDHYGQYYGGVAAYGAVGLQTYGQAIVPAYGQAIAPVYGANIAPAYGYAAGYAHAAAPLGHDGRVIDTPAVAVAKAQHFAAYSNAAHENHVGYGYSGIGYAAAPAYGYSGVYAHGAAPLGHDGRVIDTPAVAVAKAQHFAAYSNAAHENAAHSGYGYAAYAPATLAYSAYAAPAVYSGHGAVYAHGYGAPIAANGQVVDTPEVAHAKIQHFAAKAAATHGAYHY